MPQHHYSESTAQQIAKYIAKNPGKKGREISVALGLRREHVNSWLYTPWVQERYNIEVRDYRWYSKMVPSASEPRERSFTKSKNSRQARPSSTTSQHPVPSQPSKSINEWKERLRAYTTAQLRSTSNNPRYSSMPDEFKQALEEVLQERQKREQSANGQPLLDDLKQEIEKYPPEAVERAFSSQNYDNLADEQKAALAEILEEYKDRVTASPSKGFLQTKRIVLGIISAAILAAGILFLYHFLSMGTSRRPQAPDRDSPPGHLER